MKIGDKIHVKGLGLCRVDVIKSDSLIVISPDVHLGTRKNRPYTTNMFKLTPKKAWSVEAL